MTDNISGGMKSLCENIIATHEARKRKMKDLKEHRKELIGKVASLRENFKKRAKETRADLAEAAGIWHKMKKTLGR
ncbi:MAG: hypothetical protein WCK75_03390 [Elusimicrobiota bacterium]